MDTTKQLIDTPIYRSTTHTLAKQKENKLIALRALNKFTDHILCHCRHHVKSGGIYGVHFVDVTLQTVLHDLT